MSDSDWDMSSYSTFNHAKFKIGDIEIQMEHISELCPIDAVALVDGDDSTGLKIWEGASALCEYLLTNKQQFIGKSILELGSGVGLVGIFTALLLPNQKIVLTDANSDALTVLSRNLSNNVPASSPQPDVIKLDWEEDKSNFIAQYPDLFDYIIGSDIIYSKESVIPLLSTIQTLLKPNGKAIIMYISRGKRVDEHFMASSKEFNFNIIRTDFKEESQNQDQVYLCQLSKIK
eukprot:TRINITY_DN22485_c0_g1_i1.p1 TRINITY_DN22485_c0_g1~~TRINITY_DN22485_c0_g1_i1.p1  ORF type:complete len:240 (+),score=42.20 TRINITY_DN22485_c0_g1_i1:26-721(+)